MHLAMPSLHYINVFILVEKLYLGETNFTINALYLLRLIFFNFNEYLLDFRCPQSEDTEVTQLTNWITEELKI